MNTASISMARGDSAAVLDRHAVRRSTGLPTVSLLVGPLGAGSALWRRWAASAGRGVVGGRRNLFPCTEWVSAVAAQAGAQGSTIAAVTAAGTDADLLDAAVFAAQATSAPPTTAAEDDRAKSAAERFLCAFLESLPGTTGRFELNGSLEFDFGPRAAEIDLLGRSPRIAIEIDGHFHFLGPDEFRRDRTKDWELQRRGFIVLRFSAEDVIPQLEVIRDRILDALTLNPFGADQ
jgi:hypothetical protein